MAGFALPKLRWLVVGAVGAGIWAMTQEPPSSRRTETTHRPAATASRKAETQAAPKQQQGAAVASGAPRRAAVPETATPKAIVTPASRPSELVTSSVTRPEHPLPRRAPENALYTTTRVNMRGTANASAPVVATLNVGEAVRPILRDGKWQLVSARGRKGWILVDYLHPASPDAPRPSTGVGAGAKAPVPATARAEPPAAIRPQGYTPPRPQTDALFSGVKALFGGRKPIRAPQEGDCQCPYDLMINGSQCGERSAYSRRSRRAVQCYL